MLLNVSKCKFVSFCRRRKKPAVQYAYHVQDSKLEKCAIINDLGIMLHEKVNLLNNYEIIINKARRIWGFVKRQSKEFKDPYFTKSLYFSLESSQLEYCSTVWMPHT